MKCVREIKDHVFCYSLFGMFNLETFLLHANYQYSIACLTVSVAEQADLKKKSAIIGRLRTRARKQPIVTLYFEFETVLKFYNLEARFSSPGGRGGVL